MIKSISIQRYWQTIFYKTYVRPWTVRSSRFKSLIGDPETRPQQTKDKISYRVPRQQKKVVSLLSFVSDRLVKQETKWRLHFLFSKKRCNFLGQKERERREGAEIFILLFVGRLENRKIIVEVKWKLFPW